MRLITTNDIIERQALPKIGILLTVFLNIIAVEIYVGKVAVPAACRKEWSTTTETFDSLPPPAMALASDTRFGDRAILSNDPVQLAELNDEKLNNWGFTNQRAFWQYGSDPDLYWNYVIFNGDYENLSGSYDLYAVYAFYCKEDDMSESTPCETFQLAGECVMYSGYLFPAIGVTQVVFEQINVDDKVHAIDLIPACDRPEHRKYTRYRPSIVWMEDPLVSGECAVNGTTLPSNPDDPPPCQGAIDVHFSSMVVTMQVNFEERMCL